MTPHYLVCYAWLKCRLSRLTISDQAPSGGQSGGWSMRQLRPLFFISISPFRAAFSLTPLTDSDSSQENKRYIHSVNAVLIHRGSIFLIHFGPTLRVCTPWVVSHEGFSSRFSNCVWLKVFSENAILNLLVLFPFEDYRKEHWISDTLLLQSIISE